MLVLSRKKDQTIIIGNGDESVTVMLVAIDGGKAKIGIDAPDGVPVHRGEIHAEIVAEGRADLLDRRHLLEAVAAALDRFRGLAVRIGPSSEALKRSLATDLIQLAQQLSPAIPQTGG